MDLLRHNFATDLIENGLDILHLQKLLGHSGIRSTMEYLHLANVEKDIVSPLDRLYGSGDENAWVTKYTRTIWETI